MNFSVSFLDGEYFWGGSTNYGHEMPLSAKSVYCRDFRGGPPNQMTTVFISSMGRCVHSDAPFKVFVDAGALCFEGEGFELKCYGNTLRDAYLGAMRDYFPFEGKALPHEFFKGAQYNTWMEYVYDPTEKGVLEYAHALIDHGYEPGVLIIDEGWHTRYGLWEFDFAKFPDPKAMVDELHALGFVLMLWVTPLVTPDGLGFIKATRLGIPADTPDSERLFLRNKEGQPALISWWNGFSAILDLRKECDRRYLGDRLDTLVRDFGVDGFKFDGGSYGMYHPSHVINGSPRDDMNPAALNRAWNDFGAKYRFHEYKDTFNGGGRSMIQRLCDRRHRWDGDGINTVVPSVLLQGLMGYPFICPDMVGGGEWSYNARPDFKADEELFVRMAQASALCPMMQLSWAPWRALSEKNAALVHDAAMLHKRLSGEIVSLADAASVSGEPIVRALEYVDPHMGYAEIKDEFMLGDNILVCPVTTKETYERYVTFPNGRWQSDDGRVFEGRTKKLLQCPIDRLLWFRKIN